MNIKIIVATHKKYDIPDKEYLLPVYVGSALTNYNLTYQRDDVGNNISIKNKTYCELTALYWAYKNLQADYIGLCHYRRYFNIDNVDISKYDVILPKKRHYYIETVYEQFKHAHGSLGLDVAREVIEQYYPDYLDSFDLQIRKKSLHIYNMFIMKYEVFIEYCEFLFGVLSKIEDRIGDVDRLYGYIGERLLDVYLTNNNYRFKEVNIINVEPINWPKKIYHFLERKIKN